MKNDYLQDVPTGSRLYRNTGELSFETRPQEAGTFPVTFLYPVFFPPADSLTIDDKGQMCVQKDESSAGFGAKVINEHGKIEVIYPTLISRWNI